MLDASDRRQIFGGDPATGIQKGGTITKAAPPSGTLRHDPNDVYLDKLIHENQLAMRPASVAKSAAPNLWDEPITSAPATFAKRAPAGVATLTGDWYKITDDAGNVLKAWHRSLGPDPVCFDIPRIPLVDAQ